MLLGELEGGEEDEEGTEGEVDSGLGVGGVETVEGEEEEGECCFWGSSCRGCTAYS